MQVGPTPRRFSIAILLLGWMVVAADAQQSIDRDVSPPPRSLNENESLVWLRSDRILRGRIENRGGEIAVIQTIDDSLSTIHVPRSAVRDIQQDPSQLLRLVLQSVQPKTPRDYFQLDQWCRQNHLAGPADAMMTAAAQLFAGDARWQQCRDRFGQSEPESKSSSSAIRTVSFESDSFTASPSNESPSRSHSDDFAAATMSAETAEHPSFRVFSHSIQPILIGRCIRCHRSDDVANRDATAWSLTSAIGPRAANATRQNFEATRKRLLSEMSGQTATAESLLDFATKPHGDCREAPLQPRHAVAIDTLQRWINDLVDHERSGSQTVFMEPNALQRINHSPRLRRVGETINREQIDRNQPLNRHEVADGSRSPQGTVPRRLPAVANPTDPEIFNRQTQTLLRSGR